MLLQRALVLIAASGAALLSSAPRAQEAGRPLLIALSSFRERPLHPKVYFYTHDGVSSGAAAGGIETVNLRVDTHPSVARGGRLCVCATELENNPSDIRVWDLEAKKEIVEYPGLNTPAVEIGASISADGRWVACAGWLRPGGAAGWNLYLYDLEQKKPVELGCNTDDDEQSPSLSGDGRYVAFVSNRAGGAGLADIYLFDRQEEKLVPLPGLNSPGRDVDPALSADGRYLAFCSDRRPEGTRGAGAQDIYLYDRLTAALLPLPGLNGVGIDQAPSLAPDGRYLAFVSERASGMGERDVYLYDREAGRLLPVPGLNTKAEDFDPAVTYR